VHMRSNADDRDASREFLRKQLEAANYPLQDIDIVDESDDEIEFVATLLGTGAIPDELDAIVERLKTNPAVQHASWSLRPTE
jgi:putative Mg2+ transporter-C (MgtC) family protein